MDSSIDAIFARWNKPDSPGCVLAIIQDSTIVYSRGYGMADLERDVPLTPASVFDIGSIGKQFTAMSVLLLAEAGQLTLVDKVRQFIPELPAYADAVTLRHLLHHTSGLRDYTTLMTLAGLRDENFYAESELLDLVVRQQALDFVPGTDFIYSNTGYFLLGLVAQRVAGKPYVDLLTEQILIPLGMTHTTFNDNPKRVIKQRALSYSPRAEGGYNLEISFCGGYGDGAILTTVGDLLRWDQNFYANRLGSGAATLIDQMLTVGQRNNGAWLDYASGLFSDSYRGQRRISHGGSWAGYRSEFVRFPDQRCSIICLANLRDMDPTYLARQVADLYLADHFAPVSTALEQTPVDSTTALGPAVGFYYDSEHQTLWELSPVDGHLTLAGNDDSFPLEPSGAARYQWIEYPQFWVEFTLATGSDSWLMHHWWDQQPIATMQQIAPEPVDVPTLTALVGDYFSPELNITYQLRYQNEQLQLIRTRSPFTDPLQPVTPTLYKGRLTTLRISQNDQGQPVGFELAANRVQGIHFIRQAAR